MKILVTGGHGFIGTHYCNDMKSKGHTVFSYDLKNGRDILNTEMLAKHMVGIDLVVHFAAMTSVGECIKQPRKAFNTNVLGTYNVGLLCAKHDIPMLHVSTVAVYGNQPGHTTEESLPRCNEPYACSKLAAENLLHGIPGLRLTIARLGTVFGVGMRPELFSFIALDAAVNNKTIQVHGDGTQNRLMIYIDDVIIGLWVMSNLFKFGTYNLCGYQKISVMHTIKYVSDITGLDVHYHMIPQRQGQVFDENISISRAYRVFGWKPEISFWDGMRYIYNNDSRFNSKVKKMAFAYYD